MRRSLYENQTRSEVKFKLVALRLLRAIGAFAIARIVTRRGLRILCYHGIALKDEHLFHGKLFMHVNTFRDRMQYLRDEGYVIMSLNNAVSALRANALSRRCGSNNYR